MTGVGVGLAFVLACTLAGLGAITQGLSLILVRAMWAASLLVLPWMLVRVARGWVEVRAAALQTLGAERFRLAALVEAGWRAAGPWLVVVGLAAAEPQGFHGFGARLSAGALAMLPALLFGVGAGILVGEAALASGLGPASLRRGELLAASLAVLVGIHGRVGQGEGVLDLASAVLASGWPFGLATRILEGVEPPAWSGLLAVSACLLAAACLATPRVPGVRAWRAARPDAPEDRLDHLPAGVPGVLSHVWRGFREDWGWPGLLTMFLVPAGVARDALLLARGGADPARVLIALELALVAAAVLGAPDWIPPPGPDRDPPGARSEPDRALAVGVLRFGAVLLGIVAGLALTGRFQPSALSILALLVLGAVLPCLGLATLALRMPGSGVTGAALYLAGILVLVLPHLVLDGLLVVIRDLPSVPDALGHGWLLTKLLASAMGLALGTWLPLVYCEGARRSP